MTDEEVDDLIKTIDTSTGNINYIGIVKVYLIY